MGHEPRTTEKARRRQFSLRALLVVILACGLLLGVARPLRDSGNGFALSLFAILSLLPLAALTAAGRRAYLLAYSASYGPFLGMSGYTQIWISCSHCKQAAWFLLPSAPAILPAEFGRQFLNLPQIDESLGVALGVCLSAAFVAGLAAFLRGRRWYWQALSVVTVGGLFTMAAIGLLAAIRA